MQGAVTGEAEEDQVGQLDSIDLEGDALAPAVGPVVGQDAHGQTIAEPLPFEPLQAAPLVDHGLQRRPPQIPRQDIALTGDGLTGAGVEDQIGLLVAGYLLHARQVRDEGGGRGLIRRQDADAGLGQGLRGRRRGGTGTGQGQHHPLLIGHRQQVGGLAGLGDGADVGAHEAVDLVAGEPTVAVLIRLALQGAGEGPAQGAAEGAVPLDIEQGHLRDLLVFLAGSQKGEAGEVFLAQGRRGRGQIQFQFVVGDGADGTVADLAAAGPGVDAAGEGAGVAGIGEEEDRQPLVVGLLEPLIELIVQDALPGPVPLFGIATQQQDFVLAVLLAALDPLRLLRTVTRVGQHQGIAGLGAGHQVPPVLDQVVAGGLGVEPDA